MVYFPFTARPYGDARGTARTAGGFMPLTREMQRLRAEHAALVTLSRIIGDMVREPRPARPTELASARSRLRDTLVRHLKCEDWVLYPRLMATGDPELMRITRDFEIEMGDLAADFVAYD